MIVGRAAKMVRRHRVPTIGRALSLYAKRRLAGNGARVKAALRVLEAGCTANL